MTVEIWHRIMPWEIKTKLINQNNTFIKTYEPVKNATKKTTKQPTNTTVS